MRFSKSVDIFLKNDEKVGEGDAESAESDRGEIEQELVFPKAGELANDNDPNCTSEYREGEIGRIEPVA